MALALALGKRPELLLLDEPLASLDLLARRQFLQELMEAGAAEGLTVILSSHLIGDLERVCDHLVILNQGRVQVDGAIGTGLAEPTSSSHENDGSCSGRCQQSIVFSNSLLVVLA